MRKLLIVDLQESIKSPRLPYICQWRVIPLQLASFDNLFAINPSTGASSFLDKLSALIALLFDLMFLAVFLVLICYSLAFFIYECHELIDKIVKACGILPMPRQNVTVQLHSWCSPQEMIPCTMALKSAFHNADFRTRESLVLPCAHLRLYYHQCSQLQATRLSRHLDPKADEFTFRHV